MGETTDTVWVSPLENMLDEAQEKHLLAMARKAILPVEKSEGWNPLRNREDAFDLVCLLGMTVYCEMTYKHAGATIPGYPGYHGGAKFTECRLSASYALRLAIVRAAAEYGEALMKK